MALNLAQKIIAKASGRTDVTPGEVVTCKVDLAMIHDSGGPRRVQPILDRLGVGLWDPSRVVLVTDHFVPASDQASRDILDLTGRWARQQNVGAFYDGQGICHVVLPERGHLKPGMFVVGGDSHSPTGGAFGAYMFGVGATEMAGVLATGEIWLKVPETIQLEWTGRLGPQVTAKDMMLHLCATLGMDGGRYQAVQYTGSAVTALAMQERMTLSNMTAELGGQTGLIAPDAVTEEYIRKAGAAPCPISQWICDPDAKPAEYHEFDASALAPQVAAPHSPANSADAAGYAATPVDLAYIGACTGAKLEDLAMAASVLKDRKPAPGVSLLVAPASRLDQDRAEALGVMKVLEDAGARILPTSCGICAGYGSERLGEDVTCISSTARNFKGRMGAASSRVYLASAYTVAASAVAGQIIDPRDLDGSRTVP